MKNLNSVFSGTIWALGVKAFCGVNNGQHFYIQEE
jgi:hypothetical protein